LLSRFRGAHVERIDVAPSDLGVRSIGHLGLFRPGPAERIWRDFLAYASRHAER
jgi:predicted alpha/beta hydrolase